LEIGQNSIPDMTNPILEKFYQEIVGQGDFELFPKPLPRKFRDDDQRVLKTGVEMSQMVELFLRRQGLPDYFLTTKMPIPRLQKRWGRCWTEPGEINAIRRIPAVDGVLLKSVSENVRLGEARSFCFRR